jgi:hypothetical protein
MRADVPFRFIGVLIVLLMFLTACQRDLSYETNQDSSDEASSEEDPDDQDPDDIPPPQSSDDDDDVGDGECSSGHSLTFVLNPGTREIPYPSEFLTTPDSSSLTGSKISLEQQSVVYLDDIFERFGFVRPAVNKLNGFGTSTPIWFPATVAPEISGLPDAEDPGPEDAIFCIRLSESEFHDSCEFHPLDVTWMENRGLIRAAPHLPFSENARYACIATDLLTTAGGECYEPGNQFKALAARSLDSNDPLAGFISPYRETIQPTFDFLEQECGLDRDRFVSATVFDTLWFTPDLLNVRDQIEQKALEQEPEVGEWTRVSGNRTFLDSAWDTPYETINWRKKGVFPLDANGVPQPNGTETVTLRLSLPKAGLGYDPPYPVVIYGHGANDSRNTSTSAGDFLAEYGFATVGIDFTWHGARDRELSELNNDIAVILQSIKFFNVLAPLKMRDNFRQGVADIIYLKHVVRSLAELDLAPYATGGDGIPDLDTSSIYYMGMSLGSIHGGIVAAVEPDIDTYIFNVGAADYRTISLKCPIGNIAFDIVTLIESQFEWDISEDLLLMLDLALSVLDAADPYNYGSFVLDEPLYDLPGRKVNILHQMVSDDDTLGGPGSAQMARSLGLTLLRPYPWDIDGIPTGDAPFYGPATYMYETDNHNFLFRGDIMSAGRQQAGVFMRTAFDGPEAVIIDPFAD